MKKDFLIFDVETSGFWEKDLNAYDKGQAWIVQIAGIYTNWQLNPRSEFSLIMAPPHEDATISEGAEDTHGISLNRCKAEGLSQWKLHGVLNPIFFNRCRLVGHNIDFDYKFLHRYPKSKAERKSLITAYKESICTMRGATDYCELPPTESMLKAQAEGLKKWKNWKPQKYKAPKLEELVKILFGEDLEGAHDAMVDVRATLRCLKELVNRKVIKLPV